MFWTEFQDSEFCFIPWIPVCSLRFLSPRRCNGRGGSPERPTTIALDLPTIRVISTAMGQNRRALRRFFCPRITLIYANRKRDSHAVRPREDFRSWECRASSHRFSAASASIECDSPRRVALQKLRQIEQTSFLLAFIRVFRGLNFGCGGAALGDPWLPFLSIFVSIGVHSWLALRKFSLNRVEAIK